MVEARQSGTNIVKEIISCEKYQVLCIDPEHLNEKEWQEVVKSDKFWSNVVYVCVEEAHLINEWGASFRPLFKRIGQLIRGRVPSSCAVFALTATLQPGKDTASVCQALGFREGNYFLVRRSNERPNIHFAIETLKHGVNSDVFPQLLPYLNSGRKAIIHCSTIDQVYRVYVYLWSMEPDHADHMRRVRMYFSLSSDEYNRENIRLLNDDSYCQVVIATVAFANGINCRTLLDSISIGAAKTLDQIWQEKGRVARILELAGRGVVLVQPSDLKAAEKLINGSNTSIQGQNDVLIRKLVGIFHTTTKKTKTDDTMDYAKALLLAEKVCYVAAINRIYRNPPTEETYLDCLAAERRFPCSLCCARANIALEFAAPLYPDDAELPPPFLLPAGTASSSRTNAKTSLTKKERAQVQASLMDYGSRLRQDKRSQKPFLSHELYFPSVLCQSLVDHLLTIASSTALSHILDGYSWYFTSTHQDELYNHILALQSTIINQRDKARTERNTKKRQRRKGKPTADSSHESESESEVEEHSDREPDTMEPAALSPHISASGSLPKRIRSPALNDTTNTSRPRRQRPKKIALQSAAEVAASFRPQYTTTSPGK